MNFCRNRPLACRTAGHAQSLMRFREWRGTIVRVEMCGPAARYGKKQWGSMRNLKIGPRLSIGLGVILFMLVLNAVIGVVQLRKLAETMQTLTTTENKKQQLATAWLNTVSLNNVRTRASLLGSTESVAGYQKDMDETSAVTAKVREQLVGLVTSDEGKARIAAIDAAREAYRGPRAALLKRKLAGEDIRAEADALQGLSAKYSASIEELQKFQAARFNSQYKSAEDDAKTAEVSMVCLGFAAAVLCVVIAIFLSRSIRGPLQAAAESSRRIADGDLSEEISVTGRDEASMLMESLKAMQANLGRVVGNVRMNADGVATASSEIAQGNHDLSGRTEQQAAALEETAASMEELSSTVQQNAENAQQANKLAQGASSIAVEGGQAFARVVETMKGISESSREISDIIGVIDGIAFQTNILALNAAVEAARAGEQGRGFAVVATEVRSLAQRSAEAAKRIKGLIGSSVDQVNRGTALIDQAEGTMKEVVSAIRRVTDLMGEISAASVEQSAGVAQVGEAITQMDQATQQNAALVEQSAAAASALQAQANQLVQAVAIFNLTSVEHSAYEPDAKLRQIGLG